MITRTLDPQLVNLDLNCLKKMAKRYTGSDFEFVTMKYIQITYPEDSRLDQEEYHNSLVELFMKTQLA